MNAYCLLILWKKFRVFGIALNEVVRWQMSTEIISSFVANTESDRVKEDCARSVLGFKIFFNANKCLQINPFMNISM